MTESHEDEYSAELVESLEVIWGEGFLSPGGPEAVAGILEGLDIRDQLVLDIGCGVGGVDVILARDYGARVIGLDLEADLVERARQTAARTGLADRIEVRVSQPGPLPIDDSAVDVVFGKDSWIHVADKAAFFAEAFRALKPGGILVAGDWMRGPDPYSADMAYFFELEGLTYHMDTLEGYGETMRAVGFEIERLEDISEAYRLQAREEYDAIQSSLAARLRAVQSEEAYQHLVENWRMLVVVLDNGELRPGRFRARKPL